MKPSSNNTSLLEFPTDFPIKVVGDNTALFKQSIVRTVNHCLSSLELHKQEPLIREQMSRTEKYISLTITLRYSTQCELDNMYRALTRLDSVKMVL